MHVCIVCVWRWPPIQSKSIFLLDNCVRITLHIARKYIIRKMDSVGILKRNILSLKHLQFLPGGAIPPKKLYQITARSLKNNPNRRYRASWFLTLNEDARTENQPFRGRVSKKWFHNKQWDLGIETEIQKKLTA